MRNFTLYPTRGIGSPVMILLVLMLSIFISTNAGAFTVNVVDQDGAPIPTGFKWMLEEDNTHPPQPGVHTPVDTTDVNNNTLSIGIHRSHAPVVASGETPSSSAIIPDPPVAGRYFVSVLPYNLFPQVSTGCDRFDMGGAPIDTTTQSAVTVYVRRGPIETAQISVKVFHDIAPLNNAPDIGEIDPVNNPAPGVQTMEGFTVTLGDQGGDIVQDAFGNALGTTYMQDENGNYVLDPATCEPIVDTPGSGDFTTPPNGELLIKNLAPGKYAVQVEPPANDPGWHQVTTIEGTKTIDAWVRPNEPPFLVEFGPPFWHIFMGFTKDFNNIDQITPAPGTPVTQVTGQIRKGHLSRPPAIAFFEGPPPEGEAVGERCIVGLNVLGGAAGAPETVYVGQCEDETGNFTIPNVPPGTYQLVVFDISLLHIISFNTVITADTGGVLDLGQVTTPMWFGVQEHYVFADNDKDGIRDCATEACNSIAAGDEIGIPEQNVNLRFRDGTIYQAFPTDTEGFVPFQSIFPFFHWQVAEVDFARLEATGATFVVDDGGPVSNNQFGEGKRNPQDQSDNPGLQQRRVERGPVLTEGYQIFAGQNTRFEWGKAPYDGDVNAVDTSSREAYFQSIYDWPNGPGDIDTCTSGAFIPGSGGQTCDDLGGADGRFNANGGISGTVTYATTRAEDDPRYQAVEPWEPGVPRVQVNLYRDQWCNSNGLPAIFPLCPEATPGEIGDGIADDRVLPNGNTVTPGVFSPADVDNYPLNWAPENCPTGGQTCLPGPEDVDHNGNGLFNINDAIRVTWTDSWDDSLPEGCRGDVAPLEIHGTEVPITQCAEGLRTWNQVRPGVFDGGFAFGPGDSLLVPGTYIVEAVTPPGYKLVKEEDRNVDFGPTPIPAILPPVCVGDDHEVPPLFSFLTDGSGNPLPGVDPTDPDNAAPFAGDVRKLCDRKKVDLGQGQNAAVEFHVFTDVPKSARAVGIITDDLANELAPNKPTFTEKFSPPWISIAVFDYTGQEIFRTYGDEYGAYNWLSPSSYAINLPTPSGVGPKMNQFCLNHPGPIPDPDNPGEFITDPRFRKQYSTTCYTFNFEPGRITYLDTPIIRNAAFVGALQQTLDCELPQGTPRIRDARNMTTNEWGPLVAAGETLRLRSMGQEQVPNPDFPGDNNGDGVPDDPPTEPEFVNRNYGFGGNQGQLCVIDPVTEAEFCFADGDIQTWNANIIRVNVPNPLPAGLTSGQLIVRRANGNVSEVGITLTVDDGAGSIGGNVVRVGPDQAYTTIQEGIDMAADGDLILVDPGTYYELPILYKRVKLQGSGDGATMINASHFSSGPGFTNPLVAWREKVAALVASNELGLLPEQDPNQPDFFLKDGEGPGIFVSPNQGRFGFGGNRNDLSQRARIDGFQITLADLGGGVYVNAYGNRLQVSNNRIGSNAGNLGGGIRIGNPTVVAFARGGVAVENSPNPGIDVYRNHILTNGSLQMGGGVSVFKGANNYRIEENFMCGNFARSGGGGIAHRGLSTNGLIAQNEILFNEVFQGNQPGAGLGIGGGGGGIEIAGDEDPGATASGLTEGTGSVTVDANLFQGNLGGAADGGAMALRLVNGDDVASNPTNAGNTWHRIDILNNLIVNNVTGLAGAGIALQDAADVRMIHNTIANNDSVATSTFAFANGPAFPSTPQVAGIVSRAHSTGLLAVIADGSTFSNPRQLRKNILWQNRSFGWTPEDLNNDGLADGLFPNPDGPNWDLGVIGTGSPECLDPRQSLLTDLAPAQTPTCSYFVGNNIVADPDFVDPYNNTLVTAAAADEGGNFVQVYYTPLGLTGNYHLRNSSPAINAAAAGFTGGRLSTDVDGEPRPSAENLNATDMGADEVQ